MHRARSVKTIAKRLYVNRRTAERLIARVSSKLPTDFEPGTRPFIRVLLWALQPIA